MKQRGKKSAAALAISAPTGLKERLPAPVHLSDAEISVWLQLVNDQPAEAFTPTHVPLLEAYCRHVVRGRVIAAEIDAFDAEWIRDDDGLRRYEKLLTMADREARAASSLATRLRITRHSQVHKDVAGRAQASVVRSHKPWEVPEHAASR
jgi:hypothetical protein